jgi:2'-5' RNA ligase
LWLVPESEFRARLAERIETLARLLGTQVFEPHVTLLGGVERPERDVREECAVLARSLAPLVVRLGPVDALDDYFKCVFARVEENRALHRARAAAQEALGASPGGFVPHLSLVYGRLSASERATALREAAAASGERFVARRLDLWRTVGEVREWRFVEAWALEGRRRSSTASSRKTRDARAGPQSRLRPRRRRTRGSRPRRRTKSSRR